MFIKKNLFYQIESKSQIKKSGLVTTC